MNMLKGYGTYLTGAAFIFTGLGEIAAALAGGGELPMAAFNRIGEGFGFIFLRRAIA